MCGAAAIALLTAAPAVAGEAKYSIAPQPLDSALREFGVQSGVAIMADADLTFSKQSPGFSATAEPDSALREILAGTGLSFKRQGDVFVIAQQGGAQDPQGGGAAGDGADGTVEALIVTAQKREEDIQDVPIAISAFTQEDLTRSQVAGGPDLMTQVPNFTFTKTNFSGYSIQIRGIGTQAISATVDPAVAVAFNNASMIRNRFFEQEFYDLQRVEVLRGPQGTLYGRNATAGVVNLLTARPAGRFEAKLSADVANYNSTRLEGMINLPLVEDVLAMRLAGAWTKRDGYVTNQTTGEQIDGRNLWSTRLTLGFEPTDRISAYLTWEHFEEDDDRLRSGKQLCQKDAFAADIGGIPLSPPDADDGSYNDGHPYLSQGCSAASLYSPDSFQTPNGYALPYYAALSALGNPVFTDRDIYVSATQSRDLRVIESTIEPDYRAKTDIAHLQFNFDLSDTLSLVSETAYTTDWVFSTQDFNRFTTVSGSFIPNGGSRDGLIDADGVFCDPQLGCSDKLLLGDLSTARSAQFSQELRLSSDTDGPLNFSLGANFVRYDTEDKYYVFVNTLTMFAANFPSAFTGPWVGGVSDNSDCLVTQTPGDYTNIQPIVYCTYIDPNPISNLNDQGHNYFLSKNPYRLISYAAFGEVYYNLADNLKITGGLRYTVDKKRAPQIPSWLLAAETVGYPVVDVADLTWKEPTGRLAIDWKPDLNFTDETMVYASYAHGYKAGGANPPPPVLATYGASLFGGDPQKVVERIISHPKTFEAEYVDAFEIGAKNTLLDGRLTFNTNLFYYDYKGYQISQIVNRSAINLNFDAKVWGAELEADWRPLENLRFGLKLGYENTRLADGSQAIDLIDRTAGDPDYIVLKPFPSVPSNCIVPVDWVVRNGSIQPSGLIDNPPPGTVITTIDTNAVCTTLFYSGLSIDGLDPSTVPNNGEGIFKDLSGNELPNAPDLTSTLSIDYTLPLPNEWLMTLHADLYRQSEAWTRVFNMEGYDKLKAYTNVNFAAIFTNEEAGWNVMAYVKNVFDRDSITGAFLNSDDTGLTTNVFLTEPRLYGIRVTKAWEGGPLGSLFGEREGGGPYPWTVEIGGAAARFDAPMETFRPAFTQNFTSPELPFPFHPQEEDLDWGDSREIKISYGWPGAAWRASASMRRSETNGAVRAVPLQKMDGGYSFNDDFVVNYPQYAYLHVYIPGGTNYASTEARRREEHTLVDFMVGRDLGLGGGLKSQLSLGIRYAQFKSSSRLRLSGISEHDDLRPENIAKYSYINDIHRYDSSMEAQRKFEGSGPAIAWDAAMPFLGDERTGRLNLDFGATAGAFFGKRTTSVQYQITDTILEHNPILVLGLDKPYRVISSTSLPPFTRNESDSTTVYSVGANLGLSYEIQRFKFSGGYRWERYFDAIDGGIDERQDADRTIDGPYFKIAVGFGG